jgi:hypothetical protein
MNIVEYSVITAKNKKFSINYVKLKVLQLYKKVKSLPFKAKVLITIGVPSFMVAAVVGVMKLLNYIEEHNPQTSFKPLPKTFKPEPEPESNPKPGGELRPEPDSKLEPELEPDDEPEEQLRPEPENTTPEPESPPEKEYVINKPKLLNEVKTFSHVSIHGISTSDVYVTCIVSIEEFSRIFGGERIEDAPVNKHLTEIEAIKLLRVSEPNKTVVLPKAYMNKYLNKLIKKSVIDDEEATKAFLVVMCVSDGADLTSFKSGKQIASMIKKYSKEIKRTKGKVEKRLYFMTSVFYYNAGRAS